MMKTRMMLLVLVPIALNVVGCAQPDQATISAVVNLGAALLTGNTSALQPTTTPLSGSVNTSFLPTGLTSSLTSPTAPTSTGTTTTGGTSTTTTGGTSTTGTVGSRDPNGGLAVPLIDQNDTAKPSSYCGPTSVAMCLAYYGRNVTAANVEEIATGSNPPIYEPGGAIISRMAPYLQSQGLSGTSHEFGKSISWLAEQTNAGYPVIVHVKGDYGPRSTNGHFVVVTGVTSNGDVIIADPAGGKTAICDAGTFDQAWKNDGGDCVVVKP